MREPVDGAELHDAPLPHRGAHLGREPGEYYQWGDPSPSPVPKLNLQLLILHDYLLRNFKLFKLVSTYERRRRKRRKTGAWGDFGLVSAQGQG